MPSFGKRSTANLSQCDPRLVKIFEEVVKRYDCTIITGHRERAEQDEKFRQGLSKVEWPNSRHNQFPSMAVDAAPYKAHKTPHIDWNDSAGFYHFAGYVQAVADSMGTTIRFGGDWDQDKDMADNRFMDLGHFELVEE